jgi:hypothetical protein
VLIREPIEILPTVLRLWFRFAWVIHSRRILQAEERILCRVIVEFDSKGAGRGILP